MAKTGRQSFQQMLRLPDDMRDQLKTAADANGRSMNAEIVERLQQSLHGGQTKHEVLYVLLDANGFPTSWPEITTHLSQIAKAGGFDPAVVQGHIFNASVQKSAERDEQWFELVEHYRGLAGLPSISVEDDEK